MIINSLLIQLVILQFIGILILFSGNIHLDNK